MKFQRRRLQFIGDIFGAIAVVFPYCKSRGAVIKVPLPQSYLSCAVSSTLIILTADMFPTFKFCRSYHRERGWNDYVRRRLWKRFFLIRYYLQ